MGVPYVGMVCEMLESRCSLLPTLWGFMESQLRDSQLKGRPWCVVEASKASVLYLPALSPLLRQAAAEAKLFWVHCEESEAPLVVQKLLESSLCEGVLLRGLERFNKARPAALWGRRWQLAAERGASHLFWHHQDEAPLIGFDLRLLWDESKQAARVKKGTFYFGGQAPEFLKGSLVDYGEKLYKEINGLQQQRTQHQRPAA